MFSLLLNQRGIARTLSSKYTGVDQSEHVVFSIYFEFQEVFKKRYPELGEVEFESVTRLFSALGSNFELIKKSSFISGDYTLPCRKPKFVKLHKKKLTKVSMCLRKSECERLMPRPSTGPKIF